MDEDDKIKHITTLIDACLLPELIRELGADHLTSVNFDNFRKLLDIHLIELFDLLQQNENLLYRSENETLELRYKLLILLCEQTASTTLYQTKNHYLLNNLMCLIEKHFSNLLENDPNLINNIFKYFKVKLRTDIWKKHLGSIHSFHRFCMLYYGTYENQLRDLCTFILSVSLLLEEFYDPVYKEMGWSILDVILSRTPEDCLRDLNLHNVLYETLFQNIPKVETRQGTIIIWNCLHKCMTLSSVPDHSKWNKIDDLMSALIRRITFESNSDICIELFSNFPKLCLLSNVTVINAQDYIIKDDLDNIDANIKILRDHCKSLDLHASYRWAKKLLKLFVAESNRLMGKVETAARLLHVMHVSYLLCITTIPVKVCERHLIKFFEQFISVLMQAISVHGRNDTVVQCVRRFLETLLWHIGIDAYQPVMSKELCLYQTALHKILNHICPT